MLRGSRPHFSLGTPERSSNTLISSPYVRMESSDPSRRRQTILALIDMLSELNSDTAPEPDVTSPPILEEDVPISLDEKLSNADAELFLRFEKRIENLDKELRGFANAARQLGSSARILSSTFKLRERLTKIQFMFRENAANLYPRKITRRPREALPNPNFIHRRWRGLHPPAVKLILEDNLEPDALPAQFESFAKDVVAFLDCLNEFPEFTDEIVNRSMRSFEADLKYWASCLAEYRNQFRSPAVQRYVHDLTTEIGDHINNVTRSLSMFTEIGVPTIRFYQQRVALNLLCLSIVAILFSAVTATVLQFSYNSAGNALADSVNAFWFSSLVFSVTAAVSGVLALTWEQDMYRSAGRWWVPICIKRSPMGLLVMSVVCFFAGLVLFMYSSNQGPGTYVTITIVTAIISSGLAAMSAWFAVERWIFVRRMA